MQTLESKKRHRWTGKGITKTTNRSIVACLNCNCIREYVKGVPTYFINDTVYDKIAPPCNPMDKTQKQ